MTKTLVNLIGGLAAVIILVLGVVVVALPLFGAAGTTNASADTVQDQNDTQQLVLDGLRAQAADMDALEDEVAALRDEIPAARHLDDVLVLAVTATSTHGGRIVALSTTESEPFAVRVDEADTTAPAYTTGTDPADDTTTESGAASASSSSAAATDTATQTADAHQTSVTITIDAPSVEDATAMIDALREGPRLVAVVQATVTSDDDGVSLVVTLLAFDRP
ncbi:hypothetical protein GCM10009808_20080 [Microbacterium sediminicola]|uniref:Tfp pilus assembly protein PilO n=1 Tax=Microbacterium sediminicola TaxID=415210 RepID=A0ABN2IC10_9MICO